MIAAIQSSWALFLGLCLMMAGNGLQGTLLGVRASLEGFPTTVTGLLMSCYYAGFLGGSILVPLMVMRVGHVRVFGALAALASTAILVHAVFVEPVTWSAMRLVTGFSYAGLYVVAESWLNHQATNETRGKLLSVYMVVTLGGMAAGQTLLNLASPAGAELFILVSVLVSLAMLPMMLSASKGPVLNAPQPFGLKALYRASPTAVTGFFATGMAQGACFGMGAVYARAVGLPIAETSIFMAALLLGGVASQWPIGVISDRMDRRLVLTVITLLAAGLAALANLVAPVSVTGLMVLTFLFGGMTMPMYSLCIAYANDHLKPDEMIAASGTLALVGGSGAVLGPTAAATMMDLAGPAGFFWTLAAIHGAIGLFVLYRMTQRAGLPAASQGSYPSIGPRVTPMAAGMFGEAASAARSGTEDATDPADSADAGGRKPEPA